MMRCYNCRPHSTRRPGYAMRQPRRFVLALVWISTLTALSAQMGDPCEGYSERPPACEAYCTYATAFAGRITKAPLLPWLGPTRMMVERAWKGVEPGEIDVAQGLPVIHCGMGFPPNERLVFLANKNDQGLI